MPTMGLLSLMLPADPKNPASPKLKTPPSEATAQYPLPSGVFAPPTMGLLSLVPPRDPKNPEAPKVKTPPSCATSR